MHWATSLPTTQEITSFNGSINLGSSYAASNNLTLVGSTGISTLGLLGAKNLVLNGGSGGIQVNDTNATSLTAKSNSDVSINDSATGGSNLVSLNTSSSATGALQVVLTGSGESLLMTGPLSAKSVTLTAQDGSISQSNPATAIAAVDSVSLTAGNGSVTLISPVSTSTPVTGSVTLTQTAAVNDATGLAEISSDNINVFAQGNVISLSGTNFGASKSITLSGDNGVSISGTSNVVTNTLVLASSNGSIGVIADAKNISANAKLAVNVEDTTGSGTVTLTSASSTNQGIQVQTDNTSLVVSGAVSAAGNVQLTANGSVTQNAGANITGGSSVSLTASAGGVSLGATTKTNNAGGTTTITASAAISDSPTGTIISDNIVLHSTGSTVTLGSGLSAPSSITLDGFAGVTTTGAAISTPSLTLNSANGAISISNTDALSLTANALGSVSVVDKAASGTVSLGASSATGTNSNLSIVLTTGAANLDVIGPISAGDSVTLTATNGSLTQEATAPITASNSVSLTAGSGSVTLGNLVSATAPVVGTVSITSSAGISDGFGSSISAASISLTSTGSTITLNNGLQATTSITLDGKTGVSSGAGLLDTASLVLNSSNGAISVQSTNAGQITATGDANVGITDGRTGDSVTLNSSSSTNGQLQLVLSGANESLLVGGSVNAGDNAVLTVQHGTLTQNSGVNINAVNNVQLTAANGVTLNAGTIKATAPSGFVSIVAFTSGNVQDSSAANVQAADITFQANNGSVLLTDTNATATGSITLQSATGASAINGSMNAPQLNVSSSTSGDGIVNHTNATTLNLDVHGNAAITDNATNGTVMLFSPGTSTNNLQVSLTGASESLQVSGPISATSINLSTADGGISQSNSSATITGTNVVNLTTGNGGTIVLSALTTATSGTGTVNINSSGDITDSVNLSQIVAPNVGLHSLNGNISISSAVHATSSIDLGAFGNINTGAGIIDAPTLSSNAQGSTVIANTNASTVSVLSFVNADVTDNASGGTVALGTSGTTIGTFNFTTTSNESIEIGSVISGRDIVIRATNGNISQLNVASNVNALNNATLQSDTGTVTLSAAVSAGNTFSIIQAATVDSSTHLEKISSTNVSARSTGASIDVSNTNLAVPGTLNLRAKNDVDAVGPATLAAASLVATSDTGHINITTIDSENLTLNAAGNVNVIDIANGPTHTITVNASQASGGSFTLLATGATESIALAAPVSAPTSSLSITAANGSITQNAGADVTAKSSVVLTAGAGAVSLGATTQSTQVGGSVTITASANISDSPTGNIISDNVTLQSTAADVTLTSGIAAGASLTLDGFTGVSSGAGLLDTPSLVLHGHNGGATVAKTNASSITADAKNSVSVTDVLSNAGVTLNALSSTTGNVTVVLSGNNANLTANGAIQAGDSVTLNAVHGSLTQNIGATITALNSVFLTAGAGSVTLNDTVTATNPTLGLVSITSSAAITDSSVVGVSAANLSLDSTASTVTINSGLTGTTITLIGFNGVTTGAGKINTTSLALSSANGDVSVQDTNASAITGNATSGDFTVTDTATGGNVNLINVSAGGDLHVALTGTNETLQTNGTISGGTVFLSAASGKIVPLTGSITGVTDVTLVGNTGIDSTAGVAIGAVNLIATSATGSVQIDNTSAASLDLHANGAITVTDTATGGSVSLESSNSSTGTLSVALTGLGESLLVNGALTAASIDLNANHGGISQANNLSTITAANLVTLQAGSGNVSLSALTSATALNGEVQIFSSGAITDAGLDQISAANIVLNSNTSITINGGLAASASISLNSPTVNTGAGLIDTASLTVFSLASTVIAKTNATQLSLTGGPGDVTVTDIATGGLVGLADGTTAGNLQVTLTGTGESLQVQNAISAGNNLILNVADGGISQLDAFSTITASKTVDLTAGNGSIPLIASVSAVTPGTGLVSITQSAAINDATAGLSNITAPNVNLKSTQSNIVIANDFGVTNQLTLDGKTGINTTGAKIGASTLILHGGTGTIVLPSTNALTISADAQGAVAITDNRAASTITLNASSSAGQFNLQLTGAGSNLTVSGAVSGSDVILAATQGSLSQTAGAPITGVNSVDLTAGAGGVTLGALTSTTAPGGLVSITAANNINDSATSSISSDQISLHSTAGSVNLSSGGLHAAQSITLTGQTGVNATGGLLDTASLTANSAGGTVLVIDTNATDLSAAANGNITISDSATGGANDVTLNSSSSTNGTLGITLTGFGEFLVVGGASSGASISLTALHGGISQFASSSTLTAAQSLTLTAGAGAVNLAALTTAQTAGTGTVTIIQSAQIPSTGLSFITADNLVLTSTANDVNLTAPLSIPNSITLNGSTGVVTTAAVDSKSLTANGGTGTVSISSTSATTLSASATSFIQITDTHSGPPTTVVLIGANSTNGSVSITLTGANEALQVNGPVVAGDSVTLQTDSGNIIQIAGGTINAVNSVILSAGGAGSVSLTDTVSASQPGTSSVEIDTVSAGITSAGLSNISAANISLHSSQSSINLNSSLSATNSITLFGKTGINTTSGTLSTNTLTLTSTNGSVNINDTTAADIVVTTSTGADISDSRASGQVNVSGLATGAGAFDVTLTGASSSMLVSGPISGADVALHVLHGGISQLNSSSTITAVNTVDLNAGGGNVTLGADVKANPITGHIDISSSGNINDSIGPMQFKADSVDLHAGGNISFTQSNFNAGSEVTLDSALGASVTGGAIVAGSLTAGASSSGNVTVSSTNATSLSLTTASGTVDVTDNSTLGGGTVNLNASSAGGAGNVLKVVLTGASENLNVAGAITGDNINLKANSGSISQGAGGTIAAGTTVTLTAGSGSVSLSQPVSTANTGGTVSIVASSSITSAGLSNISSDNISLNSTGSDVNLTSALSANQSITLLGSAGVASTGTLTTPTLTADGGTGTINIASTSATALTAHATGNISITDSASNGTIDVFGSASSNGDLVIHSSGGNETLQISAPISGKNIILTTGLTGGVMQAAGGTFIAGDSVQVTAGSLGAVFSDLVTANNPLSTITVVASGSITGDSSTAFSADALVSLKSTASDITLSSTNITTNNTTGQIVLDAQNAVSNLTGVLQSASIDLNSNTNAVTIGHTNAGDITSTAALGVNITDSHTGSPVTLQASDTSAGTFRILLTGSNTDLNINGPVSGGAVVLTAQGNIVQLSNAATITGVTSVDLNANSGGVTFAAQVSTSPGGTVSVTSQNNITSTGLSNIVSDNIALTSTAGTISLTSGLQAASSISLNGTLGVSSTGGKLDTASLSMTNTSGTISVSDTNASSISAFNDGDVNVTDSASNGTVAIQVGGSTSGAFNITLTGASESLQVAGAISGATISLNAAHGGISQLDSSATISAANSVTLTAGNGSVSLQASTQATAANTGLVSINSSADITDAGLTQISAANISLNSTAGKVNLTGPLGLVASKSISLTGFTGVNASGGKLDTAALVLSDTTGTINVSNTNATSLTISSDSAVTVTDTATSGSVTLNPSIVVNGGLFVGLTGAGESLVVAGTVSANGITDLEAGFGGVTQNAGANISGSSVILNAGAGQVTFGAATIQANAIGGSVHVTSGGAINDVVGSSLIGDNIFLQSTGGAVNLTHNGLTASQSITLAGDGVTSTGGLLNTATLSVSGGGGSGAITISDTNATSIGANAPGAVTINDSATGGSNTVTLNASSSTSNTLQVTLTGAGESLSVSKAISGKDVILNAQHGGITQASTVNGSNSVQLTAGAGSVVLSSGTTNATDPGTGTVSITQSAAIGNANSRNIFADNINLTSTASTVTITLGLSAGNSINLNANGNLSTSVGSIQTPILTVNSTSGTISVSDTNASTVTATASGDATISDSATGGTVQLQGSSSTLGNFSVTLTGAESLQVAAPISGKTVTLTATNGGISQANASATITGVNSVALTAGNGSVTFAGLTKATAAGTGSVSVTASAQVTDTGLTFIQADNISLKSTGSNIALSAGLLAATSITLDGSTGVSSTAGLLSTGTLTLKGGTGAIQVFSTNAANASFTSASTVDITDTGNVAFGVSNGTAVTLTSPGSISSNGNLTATGAIILNAASVGATVSTVSISGTSITLNAPVNSTLTIANTGHMVATTGNITGSSAAGKDLIINGAGDMSALSGNITLTATNSGVIASRIHFTGNQDFFGPTVLNASGPAQSIDVDASVVVTGHQSLTLNTNLFNNAGTVTGNPLIFGAQGIGTIANSTGSIDLKNISNLVFNGKTLAILAAGSIVNTGSARTIDLSGNAGNVNGGSLRLIAGFNFTPAAAIGSGPLATPYLLGAPIANSNISLANVNINTSAFAGANHSGGLVLAVATGSVTLGNITTNGDAATGNSGAINIVGNGISTGTITANSVVGGSVTLSSGSASITGGTITVANGFLQGTGSFTPSSLVGNITAGAMNVGNANITLLTGSTGAITQSPNTTLTTTGTLSVTAGSKDFSLNTAASNFVLNTASASATISSSVAATLNTSTVLGNLSVTSSNGLNVGVGQTITAGGNLSLANSGATSNVNVGDNSVLSAGSLTASGITQVSKVPVVGLATADIQKSGSISIQSSGAAGVGINTIVLGNNVKLTSTGADITFSSTKQNSNMTTGDLINITANGGSINVNNFSGNVALGTVGGLGTTITARTLNTFQGGSLSLTGSTGVRIGSTANVNVLGSLSLNSSGGSIDMAMGSGGTINGTNAGGTINIGGSTNILANGAGLSVGGNTAFQTGTSLNATVLGTAMNLGNNVSITAGALNAGAPISPTAALTQANIKTSGSMNITIIGTVGLVGGTADSIITEGGGMNINAVGQNAGFSLGDNSIMRADGGGMNIFAAGTVNFAAGAGGGSIITRQVGPVGGSVNFTSFNSMTIGAGTTNNIFGSLFLTNIGTAAAGSLTIGANSSTVLGATSNGSVIINQIGQNSKLVFGDGAQLVAPSLINVLALGNNAGHTIDFGTTTAGGVTLQSTGQGLNITAVGTGAFTVNNGSSLLSNGGINVLASGAMNLGTTGAATMTANGNASLIGITALNNLTLGAGSQVKAGSGINLTVLGAGGLTANNGSKIQAGTGANGGGFNLFSQGPVNFGTTGGATLTTGVNGFMGLVAANGLNFGPGSVITSGAGINVTSIGVAGLNIGDGSAVTASNGGINVFSAGPAILGSAVGPLGVTLTTNGVGGFLGLTSTNGLTVGSNSTITSSSGLNVLDLSGQGAAGAFLLGDNSKMVGAGFTSITNLTSANLGSGTNAQITATGGLNISQIGTGNMAFGPSTKITVNNGSLIAFSLNQANFGAGSQVVANGNFAGIQVQGFTGVDTGAGSTFTAASGSLSFSNIGAGKLQIGNNSTLTGGSTVGLNAFNPAGDIEVGNGVTITAGSLNGSPTPPFQQSNIRQAGNINFFTSGNVGANGILIGNNATFTSNGMDISISSLSQTGKLTIGDNYNFTANGGNISVSSSSTNTTAVGSALSIGVLNGAGTSKMNAFTLGTIAGGVTLNSSGNSFVGAGAINSKGATNVSSSAGAVTISGTAMTAAAAASIAGAKGVTIDTVASIAANSNLTVSASGFTSAAPVVIGDGVVLSAGVLNGALPPTTLTPANIATAGSLNISSGNTAGSNITIGNNVSMTSVGNDLKVVATNGTLQIGTTGFYNANGGNIQMLAKGTVTVLNGDSFHARSVGTSPQTSTGGGIEIGSGLTNSANITTALNQAPNPAFTPGSLGTGVVPTNVGGTVQVNKTGGGVINLNSVATPSTLNLNKGVQIFDAQGAGSSVSVDHANFQTDGLKPIAMITPIEPDQESLATLPVILKRTVAGATAVAVGEHGAELRVFGANESNTFIATADDSSAKIGKQIVQIYARPKAKFTHTAGGALHLASGEIFLNASSQVPVKTDSVEVRAMKGALASVRTEDGTTYVRVCSANGSVSAIVNGKSIVLNSGEELVVTNHKPDDSEIHPSDGLGRRNTHTIAYGNKYVTTSDFSIMSLVSNHETLFALRNSNVSSERQLLARMLKTAATIDVVLKYRGAYTAR